MRESLRAYRTTLSFGFRAAPREAALQLATGVLMALTGPLVAYGAKLLIDAAFDRDAQPAIVAVVLLSLGTGMFIFVIFPYVDCVFTVIERTQARIDGELIRLLGSGDGLELHERPSHLDEVQRIREERQSLAGMTNATAGVLRAAVALVATSVLLAQIHPALLGLIGVGVVSFLIGKRCRDLQVTAQEHTTETERLRRHLFDVSTTAAAGKELRVFGLDREVLRRHHRVADEVVITRNRADWRSARLASVDAVVNAAAYVGAITWVLLLAVNGRATPGDVVLAIVLAIEARNAVAIGVAYGTGFLWALRVSRRFLWLQDTVQTMHRVVAGAQLPLRLEHGIQLERVSFAYPGTDTLLLRDVTMTLPAGSVVALVGENGAGKTTLAKLLCGFYRPDAGRILVDGIDLSTVSNTHWRTRITAAFQDHARFELLARETVGLSDRPKITDDVALSDAVDRAGATTVVDQLPDALDSQLGASWPGGVDLSGGQWQKVALARALLRREPLLTLLDEPTAALDAHAEHELFERFADTARQRERERAVTLLITHRFSTVRMADTIIALADGQVRESGTHDELMAAHGLYAELYTLQSKGYR